MQGNHIPECVPLQPQKLTYSVPEAAEALGVSKAKLYELTRAQGFPVLTIGKRKIIPIKALEQWVADQVAALV